MGVAKVDYFSLDVEGNEMDILRTIPFDEVDITVRGRDVSLRLLALLSFPARHNTCSSACPAETEKQEEAKVVASSV